MSEIKKVLVNWVEGTSLVMEPYEWDEDDDLEMIDDLKIIKVSKKVMPYLFYYDFCLTNFEELNHDEDNCVLAFCDGKHSIVIEFDAEYTPLSKSVLLYKDRERIIKKIKKDIKKTLILTNLVNLEAKELGITRLEREKKAYLYDKLDILYVCKDTQLKLLYQICFLKNSDDYKEMYIAFMDLIDEGYNRVHESIYQMLTK